MKPTFMILGLLFFAPSVLAAAPAPGRYMFGLGSLTCAFSTAQVFRPYPGNKSVEDWSDLVINSWMTGYLSARSSQVRLSVVEERVFERTYQVPNFNATFAAHLRTECQQRPQQLVWEAAETLFGQMLNGTYFPSQSR